jgi:hypothetical protein
MRHAAAHGHACFVGCVAWLHLAAQRTANARANTMNDEQQRRAAHHSPARCAAHARRLHAPCRTRPQVVEYLKVTIVPLATRFPPELEGVSLSAWQRQYKEAQALLTELEAAPTLAVEEDAEDVEADAYLLEAAAKPDNSDIEQICLDRVIANLPPRQSALRALRCVGCAAWARCVRVCARRACGRVLRGTPARHHIARAFIFVASR